MGKKFSDYGLVVKDLIAIVISMILVYLIYSGNFIATLTFSVFVLISLLVYTDYEISKMYGTKKDVRYLFRVSSISAVIFLMILPMYFFKYDGYSFNFLVAFVLLISLISFIWSTVELIKEEFKR